MRYNGGLRADRPDDADSRQHLFSFGLSRQRKLYTKNTIFFSEHPIIHTVNLTTNKSSARAEGPTIVLRTEKVTGVSIVLTPIRWKLTADATTDPLQGLNHLCLGGPERPPIRVTQVSIPSFMKLLCQAPLIHAQVHSKRMDFMKSTMTTFIAST